MATKRPSLAESMRQAAQPETEPVSTPKAIAGIAGIASKPAMPAPTIPPTPTGGFYAATRAGKKKVTAALDPSMHKQLKGLAVERDTTTEALLAEAIEDLLNKHGSRPTG